MALLIDTSVFIGMERRRWEPEDFGRLAAPQTAAMASITTSELLFGVHRADSETRRVRRTAVIERFLTTIPIVPFDLFAARFHARLNADLYDHGQPIGANDLIIAATALAHGFDILTDNIRHFDRVPGLVVHRPDWTAK